MLKPATENYSGVPAAPTKTGASGSAAAREKGFVFLAVLVHLFIATPLAYSLNIWTDEAFSLDHSLRNVSLVFEALEDVET